MKKAIVFLIILLIFSCKKNSTEIIIEKDTIKKSKFYQNNKVKYRFIFPDTVYLNKSYNGKIEYHGILDSITTKFNFEENSVSRYIIYSMLKAKDVVKSEHELSILKLDTIGALNNNTILLSNIKFDKLGTYYIDGIINDNVYIPIPKNKELTRQITNECRATHKVIVIGQLQ